VLYIERIIPLGGKRGPQTRINTIGESSASVYEKDGVYSLGAESSLYIWSNMSLYLLYTSRL
jgi:hypothetical protein